MDFLLLTGANGALGKAIVKQIKSDPILGKAKLVLNDLHLDNKDEILDHWPTSEIIEGDATKQSTLYQLAKKVVQNSHCRGTIINTAANLSLSASPEDLRKINTQLPTWLQTISQDCMMRFIHISSCSVYEQPPAGLKEPIAEAFPVEATSNYEASKIEADKTLLLNNLIKTRNTIVLRPGLIYGGGTRHLGSALAAIPSILKDYGIRKIPAIKGGPKTNWIHVQDLARATIKLCKDPVIKGLYNVVEEQPCSFGEVITRVCRLGGLNISNSSLPIPPSICFRLGINQLIKNQLVFGGLNLLTSLLWKSIGLDEKSKLNLKLEKEMCSYLEGDMIFDGSRLKEDHSFIPLHSQQTGWLEAMEWYKEHGWII